MLNQQDLNITKESNSVFFIKEPIVTLGDQEIEFIKEMVRRNNGKSVRLCMHKNLEDIVHEMLILHLKGPYVRPHRHPGKSVSYHIVEGQADMVLFNESGILLDVIPMGQHGSKRKFYYRLDDKGLFYTPLVRSDFLLFQEMIEGPFTKGDTMYAAWSPTGDDPAQVDRFQKELALSISQFKRKGS